MIAPMEGQGPPTPLRYAVVGLGWMAQEAVLPAFANARGARLEALVSGDPRKLDALGERYGVSLRTDYDGYGTLVDSGEIDAVYVALPNHLHRPYSERACRAGVHVLCEKPLATSVEDGRAMIEAAENADVRLMVAYRLHFDPANLLAAELVRSGTIGRPTYFSSSFSTPVRDRSDIRLKRDAGGGTLLDIGIYCINAARHLFGEEPVTAWSRGRGRDDDRFDEVHATTASVLGFPGGAFAAFTCSFDGAPADTYRILGTNGYLDLDPAYDLNAAYDLRVRAGNSEREESFPASDQVAPQLDYFSRCIAQGVEPEPDGREGLADLRIIEALHRSMETGCIEDLEPMDAGARPAFAQAARHPPPEENELVNTSPHSEP